MPALVLVFGLALIFVGATGRAEAVWKALKLAGTSAGSSGGSVAKDAVKATAGAGSSGGDKSGRENVGVREP